MKKKFKKIKWKKLLSAALALLLVAGAIAGIAVIAGKKTKTISSFAFGRGAIDAEGNHIETDQCIYTEDMFECQGLTIVPDYEASGTYQVFYYDSNESFMGSSEKIDANDGTYEKGDSFALAKYCRVVISPTFKGDGDSKVRFYNVVSYANDYTITVSKKQKLDIAKVFANEANVASLLGEGHLTPMAGEYTPSSTGVYWYERVDVTSALHVVLKVNNETLENVVTVGSTKFTFPTIYAYGNSGMTTLTEYEVLSSVGDCTYVLFDVSAYNSVILYSDVHSVDILQMVVL